MPPRTPEECAALLRKPSDLGQVFQTGVKIGQTNYGLGVFSFAFIPAGTPIGRVRGIVLPDDDYSSDYCIAAGEGLILEPASPFCYLNHSCEPNCSLMHYVKEDEDKEDELEDSLERSQSITSDDLYGDDELWSDELSEDDECFFGDGGAENGTLEDGAPEDEPIDDDPLEETENVPESDDSLFNDEENGVEIWLEAIKDILPGEQLTIDYAWTSDRTVRCQCGVPTCRGWIIDPQLLEDEKPDDFY